MNDYSGITKNEDSLAINKAIKAFDWESHFLTKILINRHVSLMKLLSIFVTTIFQINAKIQCQRPTVVKSLHKDLD